MLPPGTGPRCGAVWCVLLGDGWVDGWVDGWIDDWVDSWVAGCGLVRGGLTGTERAGTRVGWKATPAGRGVRRPR